MFRDLAYTARPTQWGSSAGDSCRGDSFDEYLVISQANAIRLTARVKLVSSRQIKQNGAGRDWGTLYSEVF